MKERTIATYTTEKFRLQLLELTEENNKTRYLCNSVGGYLLHLETGQIIKIEDKKVEITAKKYNLTKDNENYYYYKTPNDCKKSITKKYQVRLNRKIIDTSISEYTMRKLFAMYVQNQILQLK